MRNLPLVLALLLAAAPAPAQQRVLEGSVVDAATAAPVGGAVVVILPGTRGVLTDVAGRFLLAIPGPGTVRVRVSAAGYLPVEAELSGPAPVVPLERAVIPVEGVVATVSPLGSAARYQPSQALGVEALQRRAATALGEMLDGEPGVAMRSMGPAPARPVIRGLDGDRVLVLENGERMGDLSETAPDHAVTTDPLGMERVEVVRGPASLLYGPSALGGVVNLLSPDIPRDWSRGTSGAMALQGASANSTRAVFGRVARGGDRWAVTARGSWRLADDLRTPAGRLEGTQLSSLGGGAGAALQMGNGAGGFAVAGIRHAYGIPEEVEEPVEGVELRSDRATLHGQWRHRFTGRVEEGELRVAAADYLHREVELERVGGVLHEEVEHEWRRRSLGVTAQLRHGAAGVLGEGVAGLHLHLQALSSGGVAALTPDGAISNLALFVFQERALTPRLRLQAGIRVEGHAVEALPNLHFPAAGDRRRSGVASGSVGLHLRPAPGLEAAFQLARAHRAPTLEELYSGGPHLGTARYEIGDPALGHEIGHGLDLLVAARRGAIEAELTLFANHIAGFTHLAPTGETDAASGLPVHRYAASEAFLRGAEARLGARLGARSLLRLDVDLVRGSRREGEREPLPAMPPLRTRLTGEHDRGRWFAGATLRVLAGQERVAPLEPPTPGYALLGGEVGFRVARGERHTLVLRGDNLLDAEYRDHLSRLAGRDRPMAGRNLSVVYRLGY